MRPEVILPDTPSEFFDSFAAKNIIEVATICKNANNRSAPSYAIWKYAEGAWQTGRPLGSMIVFMAGSSGSGKSTTINVLFEDDNLCPTSASTSETKEPTLFKKKLGVTEEAPPISSAIGIVDVPGVFDTNAKMEAPNRASIHEFMKNMIELKERKQPAALVPSHFKVRKTVYPNIVLFAVKASDSRIVGPDSFMSKSLKVYKELGGLVDKKHSNLIVVLTNALQMGTDRTEFQKDLDQKIKDVRKVVRSVTGIQMVEVIPVENLGKKYNLEKRGDFFVLPNGELSHKNLYDAMTRIFIRNKDMLGQLLTSWYFNTNSPEKTAKINIISLDDLKSQYLIKNKTQDENLITLSSDEENDTKIEKAIETMASEGNVVEALGSEENGIEITSSEGNGNEIMSPEENGISVKSTEENGIEMMGIETKSSKKTEIISADAGNYTGPMSDEKNQIKHIPPIPPPKPNTLKFDHFPIQTTQDEGENEREVSPYTSARNRGGKVLASKAFFEQQIEAHQKPPSPCSPKRSPWSPSHHSDHNNNLGSQNIASGNKILPQCQIPYAITELTSGESSIKKDEMLYATSGREVDNFNDENDVASDNGREANFRYLAETRETNTKANQTVTSIRNPLFNQNKALFEGFCSKESKSHVPSGPINHSSGTGSTGKKDESFNQQTPNNDNFTKFDAIPQSLNEKLKHGKDRNRTTMSDTNEEMPIDYSPVEPISFLDFGTQGNNNKVSRIFRSSKNKLKSIWGDFQIPQFNFQSLGHGYCPVSEEVKPQSLLKRGSSGLKTVKMHGTKFLAPSCVSVYETNIGRFMRLSFLQKSEYEEHMKQCYGIEANIPLVVSTAAKGRWVNDAANHSSSNYVSMMREIQAATLKLETLSKEILYDDFVQELQNLPHQFSFENIKVFRRFFSRWGTHVVIEESVGGALFMDYSLAETSVSAKEFAKIGSMLSASFKLILNASSELELQNKNLSTLQKAGVTMEQLRVEGGNPSKLLAEEKLTPTAYTKWLGTVPNNPAELRRTIKLYPWYNFIPNGDQYDAIYEATREYLKGPEGSMAMEYIYRKDISEAGLRIAMDSQPEGNCFPNGTMLYLSNGASKMIENLTTGDSLLTKSIRFNGAALTVGKTTTTSFCTYLDRKDEDQVMCLVFNFSNMKQLIVTPGHMLFEYLPERGGVIRGKQAKHFVIGDATVYWQPGTHNFETPSIESISGKMCAGAYSPLTGSGTFFANGFMVTSYADTDHFALGQVATLPLKLWMKGRSKAKAKEKGTEVVSNSMQGVHPYAKFLMSVRESFTSPLRK